MENTEIEKAVSSTGKVHAVTTGAWKNGNVDPICNYMAWRGDYWGQPWKVVDKGTPITCKNCLSTLKLGPKDTIKHLRGNIENLDDYEAYIRAICAECKLPNHSLHIEKLRPMEKVVLTIEFFI